MSAGWYPRAISFGGGGARVVSSMGALTQLLESGITEHVTDWYGCSAGSLCAIAGAIGVTAGWLREASDVFEGRLVSGIREDYICDFTKVWGISSTHGLGDHIGKLINTWEPGCSDWTFADLSHNRPGTRLHISATNITQGKPVIFNPANTPDIRIIDAICASSTLPMFYAPWIHPVSGDIHCDGGILENYPWDCIPNKSDTLVVVCRDSDILGRSAKPRTINSVVEYFAQVIALALQHDAVMPKNWIAINSKNVNTMDFCLTKEDKLVAFEDGVRSVKGWLAFRASSSRLHSASGTQGIRPSSEGPNTSSAVHPSQDKTSGSPGCHNLMQPVHPAPDSHRPAKRAERRWSL